MFSKNKIITKLTNLLFWFQHLWDFEARTNFQFPEMITLRIGWVLRKLVVEQEKHCLHLVNMKNKRKQHVAKLFFIR